MYKGNTYGLRSFLWLTTCVHVSVHADACVYAREKKETIKKKASSIFDRLQTSASYKINMDMLIYPPYLFLIHSLEGLLSSMEN